MDTKRQPKRTLRIVGVVLAVIITFSGLLALDLANRGLFWQFAWSVTGEEDPVGQVRGVAQWLNGLRRPQPETAPMTPVQYANRNPFGVNTFLQMEPDTAKVEAQVAMIAEAGFGWIRQQFEWAELEVDGRGLYTDSRNDVDGDGEVDTISAWTKHDLIVDLAEQYGLDVQIRLDNPPAWARNPELGDFAPPEDYQDFVNYAVTVAERYRGRVHYYQVWNEPNLTFEWGGLPVNPEGYTELLCRTYNALKAVDPNIVVMTGAIAPTIDLTGFNLMDFIYLQRMYDAGAGACFDILSAQGYGLFSGPTDQRMRPTTVNIARNLYLRDVMVANGDAHKPIWMSEVAWNFVPSEEEYPEPIAQRYNFGQVTPQQAGDYLTRLFQRAQEEWSWVGVMNVWFFTRPNDFERNQAFYYFRMVEPYFDPQADPPFPPLPVFDAMREYMQTLTPTLYRGVHQAESHWAIGYQAGNVRTDPIPVTVEGAQFDSAVETRFANFTADGTEVTMRWRSVDDSATVEIWTDERTRQETVTVGADSWQTTTLHTSTLPETLTVAIESDAPLYIDSITVADRTVQNVFGYALVALIGVSGVVLAVITGLVQRWRGW